MKIALQQLCYLFIICLLQVNLVIAEETPTLREMIGQLVIVGLDNSEIDEEFKKQMIDYNLSGVILFDRDYYDRKQSKNIINPKQLKKLTKDIMDMAVTFPFISIDQEGGYIERLRVKDGFIEVEKPSVLAEIGMGAVACSAVVIASQLLQYGINLNFAPNVDLRIGTNKLSTSRSYGVTPEEVIPMAKKFIEIHKTYGIATAIKHFPGLSLSRTEEDTHEIEVFMTKKSSKIKNALLPFKALKNSTDMVMVNHLTNPVDNLPATLSRKTIDLLREEVGFNGVAITDDLDMKAITSRYSSEEAATLAINAGVDLLLFGNTILYDSHKGQKIVLHLENEVERGNISIERIKRAYTRIKKLKLKMKDKSKNSILPKLAACSAVDLNELWPQITRLPDDDDLVLLSKKHGIVDFSRWYQPSVEMVQNHLEKTSLHSAYIIK